MKATFSLELFYYNLHCMNQSFARKLDMITMPGMGKAIVDDEMRRPPVWVAEIMGFNEKYGYERRFLRGELDITGAIYRGRRGVVRWYIIDSGHVYEVKEQTNYKAFDHYFCTVDDEGDIVRFEKEVVDAWLKSRDGSAD
jgi:hypothetical protein